MKRQKNAQNTSSTVQANQSVQSDRELKQQICYGLEYVLDEMAKKQPETKKSRSQIDWFGLSDLTPD